MEVPTLYRSVGSLGVVYQLASGLKGCGDEETDEVGGLGRLVVEEWSHG